MGGHGSRLGGRDKGLVSLHGRPLITHVLRAMRPQVSETLIVANRNLGRYQSYGCAVYNDQIHGNLGPLAGLHTALLHAQTDYVVCVPGDAPRLPPDLVTRLWDALVEHQAAISVAHDGTHFQPLCCLVPRRLARDCASALHAGERSVNTPEELHRAENMA